MSDGPAPLAPHDFWQEVYPAGHFDAAPAGGFRDLYPAALPDGRQIALPIRVLPGDGSRAVASLILNQASFAVEDALAAPLAAMARAQAPEMIVAVPTLGLSLAANVARRLGHSRLVPLGTSRKFWYDDALSEPIASITTRQERRIYLDPRMLPLLQGRRVAVVDDVVSTGTSMAAVLGLLSRAGVRPVVLMAAMLQGSGGPAHLAAAAGWREPLVAAIASPRFARNCPGGWTPFA
jgi:adenine/guanine phosphoribosyltransferase-like PRPP-binding protein